MSNSDYGDNASVQGIEFKPATGGMISETRHKVSGGKYGPDYKYETAVHPSIGHAVRHLKAAFGKKSEKKGKGSSMRKG